MPRRDCSLGYARAAEPPGPRGSWRELVRKVADVGAEVGVLSTWEVRPGMVGTPARCELAFSTMGEGRTDAPARYAGAQRARSSEVLASQLHGRRLSRPALELLGPGRRERSERRTRRVGAVSTCVTMSKHDGIDIPSPHARPPVSVCRAGVRAGAMMDTKRWAARQCALRATRSSSRSLCSETTAARRSASAARSERTRAKVRGMPARRVETA